jgi:hypothetical protein
MMMMINMDSQGPRINEWYDHAHNSPVTWAGIYGGYGPPQGSPLQKYSSPVASSTPQLLAEPGSCSCTKCDSFDGAPESSANVSQFPCKHAQAICCTLLRFIFYAVVVAAVGYARSLAEASGVNDGAKFRQLPCRTFLSTGSCPYRDRCKRHLGLCLMRDRLDHHFS